MIHHGITGISSSAREGTPALSAEKVEVQSELHAKGTQSADCGERKQRLRLWERIMTLRGAGAGEGDRLMAAHFHKVKVRPHPRRVPLGHMA